MSALVTKNTRRPNPASIGHEDIALAVHLQLLQLGRALAETDEQTVIDVFPDHQSQRIAGPDFVRTHGARIQELAREAVSGGEVGRAVDVIVDENHMRVAAVFDGAGQDFLLAWAGTRQAARAKGGDGDQGSDQGQTHRSRRCVEHFCGGQVFISCFSPIPAVPRQHVSARITVYLYVVAI